MTEQKTPSAAPDENGWQPADERSFYSVKQESLDPIIAALEAAGVTRVDGSRAPSWVLPEAAAAINRLVAGKDARILRLEPGDKVVIKIPEALGETRCQEIERGIAEALAVTRDDVILLHGGYDLAVLRKSVATQPAPVFIQLRNARDQPIAIDRTKVLAIEGLGCIRPPAAGDASAGSGSDDYCNVYLAMLDQPLVVRGTEEEVVAAVDPTGERWRTDLDLLARARDLVAQQAQDAQLWTPWVGETIREHYLRCALRELHEAIEGKSQEECARAALGEPTGVLAGVDAGGHTPECDALGGSCICPPAARPE